MNAPDPAARQHTIETEPSEVARLIWKEIESIPERVSCGRPLQGLGEANISHFFSVAFLASLYVEEGRQVRFRASLTAVRDRAKSITLPFTAPLYYEPQALVRLAPTTDIGFRRIMVQVGGDQLRIIGFHDPDLGKLEWNQLCYHSWEDFELTIAVHGPGQIRTGWPLPLEYNRKELYATRLLRDISPVGHWYTRAGRTLDTDVELRSVLPDLLNRTWAGILERVREARHGGCFLVLPQNTAPPAAGLKIRCATNSEVLRTALLNRISIEPEFSRHQFGSNSVPGDVLEQARFHERDLAHACDLVAALANVDGAVVLQDDLRILGFGAEILPTGEAELSIDDDARRKFLDHGHPAPERNGGWSQQARDVENFGMRHRSAVLFCQRNPKSLAFVVSQDGDVSVFHRDAAMVERFRASTASWPHAV
jgi:hypothetical protein